jgi:hypothetical protein
MLTFGIETFGMLGTVTGATGGVKSESLGSPTAVASRPSWATPFLVAASFRTQPLFLSMQIDAVSLSS